MSKKIITTIIVVLIMIVIVKGYNNYSESKAISLSQETQTLFNNHCSVNFSVTENVDYNRIKNYLIDLKNIKEKTITDFLKKEDKMVFKPNNIDTIVLSLKNAELTKYSSSLNLGVLDKEFNDSLIQSVVKSVKDYENINQIEIYTLTPTESDNVPIPLGVLNNINDNN